MQKTKWNADAWLLLIWIIGAFVITALFLTWIWTGDDRWGTTAAVVSVFPIVCLLVWIDRNTDFLEDW